MINLCKVLGYHYCREGRRGRRRRKAKQKQKIKQIEASFADKLGMVSSRRERQLLRTFLSSFIRIKETYAKQKKERRDRQKRKKERSWGSKLRTVLIPV